MKLIRLYSFRCPTAKSLPLENKSTLPPSQVFANGLLSPPPPLHLSLAEGIWIISARVNSCWDCTHPRGLRDKVWISKQYLGLFALPQKPRAAQGPDHSWPKILWVKWEPFTAAARPCKHCLQTLGEWGRMDLGENELFPEWNGAMLWVSPHVPSLDRLVQ